MAGRIGQGVRRRVTGVALLVAVLVGLAVGPAWADTDLTPALTAEINEFRADEGLAPLTIYETDAEVRRAHADFVETLEPHRLFDESAAYYFGRGASGFAETQAYAQERCSEQDVLARWLASPPHRERLLTREATHLVVTANCTSLGSYGTAHIITMPATPTPEESATDESQPVAVSTSEEAVEEPVTETAEETAAPTEAVTGTDTRDGPTADPEPGEAAGTDTRHQTLAQPGTVDESSEPSQPQPAESAAGADTEAHVGSEQAQPGPAVEPDASAPGSNSTDPTDTDILDPGPSAGTPRAVPATSSTNAPVGDPARLAAFVTSVVVAIALLLAPLRRRRRHVPG